MAGYVSPACFLAELEHPLHTPNNNWQNPAHAPRPSELGQPPTLCMQLQGGRHMLTVHGLVDGGEVVESARGFAGRRLQQQDRVFSHGGDAGGAARGARMRSSYAFEGRKRDLG